GGAACEKPIVRVVRGEGSGTTFQFKNYLSTLETTEGIKAEGLPCETEGHTHWGELLEIGAKVEVEPGVFREPPNTSWPCEGANPVVRAAGGGALAKKVTETAGGIGYSSLPDTKANKAVAALVQNGTLLGKATYAEPGNAETSTARC